MSLGGGKSQSTTDVRLNGININQSGYGNAIPLLYGQNRIKLMLLWYGNFIATPHTQSQPGGKGGGGGSSNTTFTYSASMIMGLCEGPINGIGQVWKDKTVSSLAALGLTLFNGAGGQPVWSYLTTNFPSQAVPYDHTAYVAIANMQLGSSAALPNHAFEGTGFLPWNAGVINDAEPSNILTDYCTDPNHGANFNALGVISGAGVTTYQSYCLAMGFFLSPYEATQRAAVSFIQEILKITNSDSFMSAGVLNIVPYADTSVTGNGRTYTPNLTPLFSFTDDDLRQGSSSSGNDPIIVDRKPLAQTYNTVRVEYSNRANAYNLDIAEATDAQDIALNGVRVMSTLTFHSITTLSVARQVAQLILQRQLYIRSTFTFSVRADYCLLEPMDLVAINDSTLGIVNKLVRIIEVGDDQGDNITLIAEDMLVGTASAPVYNWQASQGYASNYGIAPPSVAVPLIFTAPPLLVGAGGGYELWMAVDQGAAGSWGGCDVYMSLDGTSYIFAGTINGAVRYGTLTAALASHADPDTVDTLSVALTNPATTTLQLVSGSAADYNNLRTLIYVDGEILAYQTATLTSAGNYNLTTLRRGQYGSSPALHAIGSQFARIDAGLFRVSFDPGMIGQTMHFKFCSFNVYGQAHQTLAAATDYTHVLSSTNAGQLMPGALTLLGSGVTIAGNSVFKSGGTNGNWDSGAWSLQGYTNGAFVSFRPQSTTLAMIIGLDNSPGLNLLAIDFGMYCGNTGTLNYYENWTGSAVTAGLGSSYVVGDDLSVTYDGANVRYIQNGTILRQIFVGPNRTLYVNSAFNGIQASASAIRFGADGVSTPVLFAARGLAFVADSLAYKKQATVTWTDADAYSVNAYPTCNLHWKMSDTSSIVLFGLVKAVATAPGFNWLDYAMSCNAGVLDIYESGVLIAGGVGSYTAKDRMSITYDGTTVTYLENGLALHSTAVSGLQLQAVLNLFTTSSVNSLDFGPGANVAIIDTSGINASAVTTPIIAANAVTDFGSAASASGSQNSFTYSGAPTTVDFTIITLSYTNNTGATQTLELLASCRFTVSGAGGGWLSAPRVTGTYPQSAVVGRSATSDEQYAYTGSATIANGATMTLTLSAEFKNGGTGSNGMVFAYTDAAIKFNILKR